MRRSALNLILAPALVIMASVQIAVAGNPVTQTLRQELKIQLRLMEGDLEALRQHQGRLSEACDRMQRLSSSLVRAENQGETLESLILRDEELRLVEAEISMHMLESHRLRSSLLATRAVINELQVEIARLEQSLGPDTDPITGPWQVVIEPGGQIGTMYLILDGTLIQGTYRLAGDWSGSLRGTLVAGKLRLERVDSQLGFSSIFYGRLEPRLDPPRIEGRWEATQLATGLPSGGTWVAERLEEFPDQ
jgi:hypothetical protein